MAACEAWIFTEFFLAISKYFYLKQMSYSCGFGYSVRGLTVRNGIVNFRLSVNWKWDEKKWMWLKVFTLT